MRSTADRIDVPARHYVIENEAAASIWTRAILKVMMGAKLSPKW